MSFHGGSPTAITGSDNLLFAYRRRRVWMEEGDSVNCVEPVRRNRRRAPPSGWGWFPPDQFPVNPSSGAGRADLPWGVILPQWRPPLPGTPSQLSVRAALEGLVLFLVLQASLPTTPQATAGAKG